MHGRFRCSGILLLVLLAMGLTMSVSTQTNKGFPMRTFTPTAMPTFTPTAPSTEFTFLERVATLQSQSAVTPTQMITADSMLKPSETSTRQPDVGSVATETDADDESQSNSWLADLLGGLLNLILGLLGILWNLVSGIVGWLWNAGWFGKIIIIAVIGGVMLRLIAMR